MKILQYFLFFLLMGTLTTSAQKVNINVGNCSFNMVLVEGGAFMMGNSKGYRAEMPVHQVTLNSFYIGEFEITQDVWEEVMGKNPSSNIGKRLPVERINYKLIIEFIQKLSQRTNKHFRLPTEAEWEYAARGGKYSKNYVYSGSNNAEEVAWYFKTSQNTTHEVGLLKPNELGLYDMSGNVWEWCEDDYTTYSNEAQQNPRFGKNQSYKVLRGGSWCGSDKSLRCTHRSFDGPESAVMINGFRVVMDL